MKFFVPAFLALLIVVPPAQAADTYGDPFIAAGTVAVSAILDNPKTYVGTTVTVEAVTMSVGEARNFYAHQAEEQGSSFDPSTITAPVTGPS